jgi:hypothetical protein
LEADGVQEAGAMDEVLDESLKGWMRRAILIDSLESEHLHGCVRLHHNIRKFSRL